MSGNFTVSRVAQRFGLDTLILAGLLFEFAGACIMAIMFTTLPDGGPATLFLPQFIVSFGNGLLMPNCIAGAVSVRPQAAGTASGVVGFTQMAIGAAAVQLVSVLLAGASSPMPIVWMMLAVVAVGLVSFQVLVRR
jgi:DHA1 family bicyclomycin/chloramphenicol resistance-like MFS transporter